MNIVVIYKTLCTTAYRMDELGQRHSLTPWRDDTLYYHGEDDDGTEYILPDGYEVSKTEFGETAIFNSQGQHCPITTLRGKPAIVDPNFSKLIILARPQ